MEQTESYGNWVTMVKERYIKRNPQEKPFHSQTTNSQGDETMVFTTFTSLTCLHPRQSKEPGGTVRHVLGIESHDFMSKNDEDTDEYHENNVNKNVWMISTIMMNMDGHSQQNDDNHD